MYDSHVLGAYEFENNYLDSSSQNNNLIKYNNNIIFSSAIKKFGGYSATQNVSNNWVYTTNAITTVKTVEIWFYINSGNGYWNLTEGWLNNNVYKIGIAQSGGNINVYTSDYGWLNLNYYIGADRFQGWFGLAVKFNDNGYNRLYTTNKNGEVFFERTNSTYVGTYEPNGYIWRFFSNIQDLPNTSVYIDRAIFSDICRTVLPTQPIDLKVFSINPSSGSVVGGQLVEILGQGFDLNAKVYFGNIEAENITVVNTNKITCLTPSYTSQGYVNVKVQNNVNDYVIVANGFFYFSGETYEIENAEIKLYVDDYNYVKDALLTNLSSKTYDKKYCHYNVETKNFDLYDILNSGTTATINFQTAKKINRITLYFYPKKPTNFTPATIKSGNKIKIEYYNTSSGEWKNVYAEDFNQYFCLPPVKYWGDGVYSNDNCGIIALYLPSEITTQYIRITAQEDLYLSETEITYAKLIYPTTCRVSIQRDVENRYLGTFITLNFWDETFGNYSEMEVNQSAFLAVKYKNNTKFFGELFINDIVIDVKNRVCDIELTDFVEKLKTSYIQKNLLYNQETNNNTINIDIIIEWCLYNAFIHRDMIDMQISGAVWYYPEIKSVYDEINEVLKTIGDGVLINANGLITIKSRGINTVAYSECNESTNQMQYVPILGAVYNDFLWIRGFDNIAPMQGFSVAEVYNNIFNDVWGYEYNNINLGLIDEKHYRLEINNGYIIIRFEEMGNVFGNSTMYNNRGVFQFVLEKMQGQKSFSVTLDYGEGTMTDYLNLNTDNYKYRVCYYSYNYLTNISYSSCTAKKYVHRRIYDEETGNILSDNLIYESNYYTLNFLAIPEGGVDFSVVLKYKISCSTLLKILGIGRTRKYNRTYVFNFNTQDCVEYYTLQSNFFRLDQDVYFKFWTISNMESNPVEVNFFTNKINSMAGNSIKLLFYPANFWVKDSRTAYNPGSALDRNKHLWTTARWDYNTKPKIYYTKYEEKDIEDGNIGINVRNLKYKKSTKKIDENIVKNKINVKEKLMVLTSGTLETDENKKISQQTDVYISTTDYLATYNFDTIINRNANRKLYLKFDKGGVIYEYNIPLSALNNLVNYMLNEVEIQVSLSDYPLGADLKLHPTNTTYTRTLKELKYWAFSWKRSGENLKTYYNYDSINKYGVIEENIENNKLVFLSDENYNKIIKKYSRFYSDINEQIDNISCNLNLAIDLNKYVYFYDAIYKQQIIQYKLYDIEHLIDLNNLNFETTLNGRVQAYEQY